MEKRLRMFLAFTLTFMMLMQSIAPIVTAQDIDSQGTPTSGDVIDPNAGGGNEGNGGSEVPPAGEPPADQPPANVPPVVLDPVVVSLARVYVDNNWVQAACGVPSVLNVNTLVNDTTQITGVSVLNADRTQVVHVLRDQNWTNSESFKVGTDGGTYWLKVTAAEGYVFQVDGVNWVSDDAGATARTQLVFTGVDCTVTLGPVDWDTQDLTAIEATTGVASAEFVAANGVDVYDNSVVVTLAAGYTLNELASPDWSVAEDGTVVSVQAPAMSARGLDGPVVFLAGDEVTSKFDVTAMFTPNSIVEQSCDVPVKFKITYTIKPDLHVMEGEKVVFSLPAGFDFSFTDVPVHFGSDQVGTASSSGTEVTVTFNSTAASLDNLEAWAEFTVKNCWTYVPGTPTQQIEVTTGTGPIYAEMTVTQQPVNPTPTPSAPSTQPEKWGEWTNPDDRGRTQPVGALKWTLIAPSGNTQGVTMKDTITGSSQSWTVSNCADTGAFHWEWGAPAGVAAPTVTCNPAKTEVTITWGPYVADNNNRPWVVIYGDIPANDPEVPVDQWKAGPFKNNLETTQVLDWDNKEVKPLKSDSAELNHFGGDGVPGPGTTPAKWRWWTDGEVKVAADGTITGQGRDNRTDAIVWHIQAPAGPVTSVTVEDPVGSNWIWDCDSIQKQPSVSAVTYYPADPSQQINVTCTPNGTLKIDFGKYSEYQNTPYIQIKATITDPSTNIRDELEFYNKANITELTNWAGAQIPITDQMYADTSIKQDPVPNPKTDIKKEGFGTRWDNGEFNRSEALTWKLTLPDGPNKGITVTDTTPVDANWKFVCSTIEITNNAQAQATVDMDKCLAGVLEITSVNGYDRGNAPVVTIRADILTPFAENQKFENNQVVSSVYDFVGTNKTPFPGTGGYTWTQERDVNAGGSGDKNKVSIGDFVWFDMGAGDHFLNGIQDPGESPVPGVIVNLYEGPKAEGAVFKTTTTNAAGWYGFKDLKSNTIYSLEFIQPDKSYTWTLQDQGGDDTVDSDVNALGLLEGIKSPPNGENKLRFVDDVDTGASADNPSFDAGLVKVAGPTITTVQMYVDDEEGSTTPFKNQQGETVPMDSWVLDTAKVSGLNPNAAGTVKFTLYRTEDAVFEGCPDPTNAEPVFEPWSVEIDENGEAVMDSSEAWEVNDSGVYYWIAEYVPAQGDRFNKGVTSTSCEEWFQTVVSVGDYIWLDVNRDGLQGDKNPANAGFEPPVAGALVELFDGTTKVGEYMTSTDGYYEFLNLVPGHEYVIKVTPPKLMQGDASAGAYAGFDIDGWTVKGSDAGQDPSDPSTWIGNDSNVNPSTGEIVFTAPASGANQGGGFDKTDNPTLDGGLLLKKKTPTVTTEMKFAGDNGAVIANNERVPVGSSVTDTGKIEGSYSVNGKATYALYYSQSFAVCTIAGELPADAVLVGEQKDVVVANGVIPAANPLPAAKAGRYYWIVTFTSDNVNDNVGESGCGQEYFQVPLVSIGDYVWFDDNFNGLQDEAPDRGVAGATVTLYKADGVTEVATTTTGPDGYYYFKDLQPDTDYVLKFKHNQTGYAWTKQNQGGNDEIDSDVDMSGVIASVHTEKVGDNLTAPKKTDTPTYDAGIVKLVSVGDYVWFDYDRDGVQGTHEKEEPVAGVKVTLHRVDGSEPDRTTTTDNEGYYGFKDLYPKAEYTLTFEKPENYDGWTLQNAGSDDAKDSDVDVNGVIKFTAPSPEGAKNQIGHNVADDPTLDAGLIITKVSIGDYVWIDEDLNGLQDAGEPAVKDLKVTLYDASGNKIGETKTDANGYYYFKDLEPKTDYYVIFDGMDNFAFTKQFAGDVAKDSNADPVTGKATFTTPEFGKNQPWTKDGVLQPYAKDMADDPTIDAGFIRLVSVGDYVWFDENRDGVQDPTEVPVPGVKVTLHDKDGNKVGETTTDGNGYYYFKDLYPDSEYTITFEKPDGYAGWTKKEQGGDPAKDSNVGPDGKYTFTSPKTGKNLTDPDKADNPTIDAGLIRIVSIGDYVWYDANKDGIQDAGEVPVPGVKVTLYTKDGTKVGDTTTDATGYYYFKDLEPKTVYYLIFEKPDGFAGWTVKEAGSDKAVDSNVDPLTGRVDFTSPEKGNNLTGPNKADDPTLDGGLIRLVSIGDYVWYDSNGNGKQDPGEKPAKDIKVTLYDKDGNKVGETTTDEDGYYYFKDLEPSTQYKLVFEKPKGYNWTQKNAGSNKEIDSDVNYLGEIVFISPEKGNNLIGPNMTDNPTLDAGLVVIPEKPPVVEELPKTGSGTGSSTDMIMLATLAGMVMAAGAVRLSVNKRS